MLNRRSRRGGIRGTELLLGLAVVALLGGAALLQHGRLTALEFKANLYRQRLKLPPAEVTRFVSLGYRHVYADWLWLKSIQAFGSGWITEDSTTKPIFQYFDTMTDIDPHFPAMYRFGNLIIADNRFDYVLGQEILKKGVLNNIGNHDLPYLGLYNAVFQKTDLDQARWFAHFLRKNPNAPSFMRRMEEYIEREDGRYDLAFEINVRYYLEYLSRGNDIEREIVQRRMFTVVDKINREKMAEAAWRYYDKHGEHPPQMEDIITPEMLPAYEAPTLQGFVDAVDRNADAVDSMSVVADPPEDLVKKITAESRVRIDGLPLEPNGTWYYISTAAREFFVRVQYRDDKPRSMDLPYIKAAHDGLQEMNHVALAAQTAIMQHHTSTKTLPTDEDMKSFYGRDPLGGHFVYQREAPESPIYGVYYSTAGRRISDRQEPRIGLRGRGPFPFTIEPRLSDNPVDYQWGLKNGYVQPDGTELFYLAADEPDWEAERRKLYPEDKPTGEVTGSDTADPSSADPDSKDSPSTGNPSTE